MIDDSKEHIDTLVSGVAPLPPVNLDLHDDEDEEEDTLVTDSKGKLKKKKPAKTPINYHTEYVAELERSDGTNDDLF